MTKPSADIQLLRRFSSLAGKVGAKGVFPRPDGSLLFVFSSREGRAELLWFPENASGRHSFRDIPGSWEYRGIEPQSAEDLIKKIAGIADSGTYSFLAFRSGADRPVELNRWFVKNHLTDFFEEGRTCWGEFVFRGIEEGGAGAIAMIFVSPGPHVVFEICAADERSHDGGWTCTGPLAVRISEDTRPENGSRKFSQRIEDYLFFALARSFAPDQAILRKKDAAPDAGEEKDWQSSPYEVEIGSFDAREEAPENCFFGLKRDVGEGDAIFSLMDEREGLALIIYGHRACRMVPNIDLVDFAHLQSSRFAPLSLRGPQKPVGNAEAKEIDVIVGNETAFRECLRRAADDPATRAISVFSHCLSDFIGLDLDGIVREVLGDRDIPVIRWKSTPTIEREPFSHFWEQLFKLARPEVLREKGLVNLVGFMPRDSRGMGEMRRDLERLGLTMNSALVPSMRFDDIERFFEAEITVLKADKLTSTEFEGVIANYPQMKILIPEAPFGPDRSIRFYEEILEQTSVAPEIAPKDLWSPFIETWNRLSDRASAHEAALVVDPVTVENLFNPYLFYGLPLAPLLREMGFRVRLFALPVSDKKDLDVFLPRLEDHFEALLPGDGGLEIEALPEPERLPEILKQGEFSLVFTEYPPDTRVVTAGKAPFHPRDFEMGFEGAVRSLRRLLRYAETRFFDAMDGE